MTKKRKNNKPQKRILLVSAAALIVLVLLLSLLIGTAVNNKNNKEDDSPIAQSISSSTAASSGLDSPEASAEKEPFAGNSVEVPENASEQSSAVIATPTPVGTASDTPADSSQSAPSGNSENTSASGTGNTAAEDEAGNTAPPSSVSSGTETGSRPGWSESSDSASSEVSSESSPSSDSAAPAPVATISFPYTIPNTDLVVEQVSSYSGYFIEDSSNDEVSDITAIVLRNNGKPLDFAGIGISQGERSLAFSASDIPAGAAVIIQEQSRAAFLDEPFYSCTATAENTDSFTLSQDKVSVTEESNGSLTVTNLTDKTIPSVVISYKSYIPEEEVYVGGLTYHITLDDLEPGLAFNGVAGHYVPGYSVIVKVETED